MAILAVIVGLFILAKSLPKALENLWEDLWQQIFEWVVAAEAKWREAGSGAKKLDWLQQQAMTWITDRVKLTWVQKIIAGFIVRNVVSAMVSTFNDIAGHDWLASAEQTKEYWESRLPGLVGSS